MRARSRVEQSGLVVATTFFFNSQTHHESQTAHTGYGSVTHSSPLDAKTNRQKRWRIGTFNSVRTAVWRSTPLLYAASNPLWNPQMTLFNATQVVLCTVRCDTWELVVIRAIRPVTETPVMRHKQGCLHRYVHKQLSLKRSSYPPHTNATHFTDKGNHGSDGCLGYRPISPWIKTNPFIKISLFLFCTRIQSH